MYNVQVEFKQGLAVEIGNLAWLEEELPDLEVLQGATDVLEIIQVTYSLLFCLPSPAPKPVLVKHLSHVQLSFNMMSRNWSTFLWMKRTCYWG